MTTSPQKSLTRIHRLTFLNLWNNSWFTDLAVLVSPCLAWTIAIDVMTPPMVCSTWPRVRSTLELDCLPALFQGTASFRLIVDWLLVIFIVAAHIRCLVIEVVLVRVIDHLMFLFHLCGPGGYISAHMCVHFHGSLYPMMDFTLRVWYGLSTSMSADVPWGFLTILLLIATVLGSRYFSDWYDDIGRCGL